MAFNFRQWDDVKRRPVSPWDDSLIERELSSSLVKRELNDSMIERGLDNSLINRELRDSLTRGAVGSRDESPETLKRRYAPVAAFDAGKRSLGTASPSASEMKRLSAWSPGHDTPTGTASAGLEPSFADWLTATYGGRREEEEDEDLLETAFAD